ncbi:hypothetical protein PICSAR65_01439 [Mycobacterium avium subsp. paratuberculosis]|nr:hypothetical protein PICSAR65_01439 [Mycobacterium avium subsp. paratuberculosis]
MDVGAAADHRHAGGRHVGARQPLGEDARPGQGAPLPVGELFRAGDLERDGLGGDDVHERPALLAGEHRGVDRLGVLLLAQDQAGARAAERLVHGGGHHVGVRNRGRVQPGGDQAREVCHVDPQLGADLVGDRRERREVQHPRVGRPAGDDDLGTELEGLGPHRVHVDQVRGRVDAVEADVVELAGEVQLHAVRQVPAVGQVQTQQPLPRRHQRVQHGRVGLGTRMRLHVGEVGVEEGLGPIPGDVLHHVDVLAAAVVAAAGQPLGVLVGQHAALGLQHRARDEVLRGDHLQRVALAAQLLTQQPGDVGVDVGERRRHQRRRVGCGGASVRCSSHGASLSRAGFSPALPSGAGEPLPHLHYAAA